MTWIEATVRGCGSNVKTSDQLSPVRLFNLIHILLFAAAAPPTPLVMPRVQVLRRSTQQPVRRHQAHELPHDSDPEAELEDVEPWGAVPVLVSPVQDSLHTGPKSDDGELGIGRENAADEEVPPLRCWICYEDGTPDAPAHLRLHRFCQCTLVAHGDVSSAAD